MKDFEKWRVMPMHSDEDNWSRVTGYGIFVLDPNDNGGDILPVGPKMTWTDANEIATAHNEAVDRARKGVKSTRAKVIIPTNRRTIEGGKRA
jgi:hypothetical protein